MKARLSQRARILAAMTSDADQAEAEIREDYRKSGRKMREAMFLAIARLCESKGEKEMPKEIKAELGRLALLTMMRTVIAIESEEVAS